MSTEDRSPYRTLSREHVVLIRLEQRLSNLATDAVLDDWKWWKPWRSSARYDALAEAADLAFEARMLADDLTDSAHYAPPSSATP